MYALYSKYKTNTQKKLFFSPFFPLDNHKKRKNMEKISPNRKKKIIETQGARTKRVTFFMKNNLQKKEKQTIIVSGKEFRKRRLS